MVVLVRREGRGGLCMGGVLALDIRRLGAARCWRCGLRGVAWKVGDPEMLKTRNGGGE